MKLIFSSYRLIEGYEVCEVSEYDILKFKGDVASQENVYFLYVQVQAAITASPQFIQ